MSEPRRPLSDAELERVLAECRVELALPPVPDVAGRLRRHLSTRPAPTSLPSDAIAETSIILSNHHEHGDRSDSRRPSSAPSHKRWLLREVMQIAAALVVFALVAQLLSAVLSGDDDPQRAMPRIDILGAASPSALVAGEILVSMDPGGGNDYQLYVVSTDGTAPHRFTMSSEVDSGVAPVWSPDGRLVAFFVNVSIDQAATLLIADAAGNILHRIPSADGWMAWSSDSTRIVYTGGTSSDLFVLDMGSFNIQQLTDTPGLDIAPAWSPDGRHIAFLSNRESEDALPFIMNADGTDQHMLLTQIPQALSGLAAIAWSDQPNDVRWSPDGSRIAFSASWIGNWSLIVNADGSDLRGLGDGALRPVVARWSPDGSQVAFVGHDAGGSVDGIFVSTADGSNLRQVTSLSGLFDWSPDGRQLAVVTERVDVTGRATNRGDLTLVNVDGSGERRLFENVAIVGPPAWRPGTASAPLALATPTTAAIPVQAGEPIPLPAGIASPAMGGAGSLTLVAVDHAPLISQGEAMQVIQVPWTLDGVGVEKALSIQAWYGLVTIELGQGQDRVPPTPVLGADGTILDRIVEREAWIIDYEYVPRNPTDCPVCPPPDGANHSFYVVDALTRMVVFYASYRTDTAADSNPPTFTPVSKLGYCPAFSRPWMPPDLYIIDADGSNQREFDIDGIREFGAAAWSPDGKFLAVSGYQEDGQGSGVFIANADGTEPRLVAPGADANQGLAWSPDSAQIVMARQDAGSPDIAIVVVNADGSNERQIAAGFDYGRDPVWSPDGRWIAITSLAEGSRTARITVMHPDGSEQHTISGESGSAGSPSWLPDGRIAFTDGGWFAANTDGSDVRPIDILGPGDGEPTWSPDGARVAFTRIGDVWVMNADGSGRTNLTRYPATDSDPRWSADGRMILFTTDRNLHALPSGASHGEPVPIVLRVGEVEQRGALGNWCRWDGAAGSGAEFIGVGVPDVVEVAVIDGSPLPEMLLDFNSLDMPTAIAVEVYGYAGAVSRGRVIDGVLALPCIGDDGAENGCVVLRMNAPLENVTRVTLDLSPGEYIIVVTATFEGGGRQGYTEQGFHVRFVISSAAP